MLKIEVVIEMRTTRISRTHLFQRFSATQPLNDCSPLRLAYDQSIRTSSSSAPSVGASRHRKQGKCLVV